MLEVLFPGETKLLLSNIDTRDVVPVTTDKYVLQSWEDGTEGENVGVRIEKRKSLLRRYAIPSNTVAHFWTKAP